MARIYDKNMNLPLNDELIEKLQDPDIKKYFFPYQNLNEITNQNIIRSMIQYSYKSIKNLKNNE